MSLRKQTYLISAVIILSLIIKAGSQIKGNIHFSTEKVTSRLQKINHF